MNTKDIIQLPTASLAYLGDAVLEVMVREMLVLDGKGDIHERALEYVTAVSQSAASDLIMDDLTEEELSVFKRGRNSTHTAPKSATRAQYSRATGLECVFAYLYLSGQLVRMQTLFQKAFKKDNAKP